MSTELLVKIPFEYDDKSSDSKDDNLYNLDLSQDSTTDLPRSSSPFGEFKQIFSPSETYKHNKSLHSRATHVSFDLVRVITPKECSMLKKNINHVLIENNYDLFYEFNLSQFISIFKKILVSSPEDEITKLFTILTPINSEIITFERILNCETNLNILLEAMGCSMAMSDSKNGMKYSMNKHREFDLNKPILSWRNDNDLNVNHSNYMEYIEYQRDVIETLRNEINDRYKPVILKNKEMEITMESLSKQVSALQFENEALQNEMQLLEQEVVQMKSDCNEYNEGSIAIEFLQRRMSHSYAEIQESHECLESELMLLQQNLHRTQRQNNKKKSENNKLQQINDKYTNVNENLRLNLNRKNTEICNYKMLINEQNDELNRVEYELFEREQTVLSLNLCVDDLSQHIQFMKSRPYSAHSARSTCSRRRKRSDFNHLTLDFDIFTDMVLSPNTLSQFGDKLRIKQEDDNKDQLIHALQNDLNELQNKFEAEIMRNNHCKNILQIEHNIMENIYYSKKVKKSVATQINVLSFWDKLLAHFECVPFDDIVV